MKKISVKFLLICALSSFSFSAFAELNTEDYDSDVTNYIMEIHERIYNKEITQQDLDAHYRLLVQSPEGATLAKVTRTMFEKARNEGVILADQKFLVLTHRVVLGDFSRNRRSSQEKLQEDFKALKSGKVSQSIVLQKRLSTPQGRDRMAEIMSGDIQQERFKDYMVSQN